MDPDPFSTTQWSVVVAARDASSAVARRALGELARTYWRPLYDYVRRRSYSPQDAEDMVQSFFLRFIEKNYLESVSAEKGRFRAFLLAALKHFLADEYDKKQAKKRGGAFRFFSMNTVDVESVSANYADAATDPEAAFHRAWAIAVLDETLVRLERQYREEGKGDLFTRLTPRLSGDESQPYDEIANALNMEAGAVRIAAHRLRRRYRTTLKGVIGETLNSGENIEDELRFLFTALG